MPVNICKPAHSRQGCVKKHDFRPKIRAILTINSTFFKLETQN